MKVLNLIHPRRVLFRCLLEQSYTTPIQCFLVTSFAFVIKPSSEIFRCPGRPVKLNFVYRSEISLLHTRHKIYQNTHIKCE